MGSALAAVGLANEDVFLKWAKEQGKQYKTKAELTMRQAIFMKNYNRMVEHNKDFDAGKVTWARGVNQWYDLTMEEWRAEMGIGMSGGLEEPWHRFPCQGPETLWQLRRLHHRCYRRVLL